MTCREKILSEDFQELLIDYMVPDEIATPSEYDYCIQRISNGINIVYFREPGTVNVSRQSYYGIPKCYGLMQDERAFDPLPLINSGITQVQREPLSLTGSGVVIGFIDTGIRYTDDVFRDSSGNSRILSIWDQTIQEGRAPEGFLYGSEYNREKINEAVRSQDPRTVVPSWDENGHGTELASVAAGSSLDGGLRFMGAAPNADIVVVKLRETKNYLREYYRIPEGVPAYAETDIMAAVKYVESYASTFIRPVVICIGVGSNSGDHAGTSFLDRYLDEISRMRNRAVVVCGGNEGEASHHYQGMLDSEPHQVEIRVGERESGFILEFWGESPNLYSASVRSPGGETVANINGRTGQTLTYQFVFEQTELTVDYVRVAQSSGRGLILFRFVNPTPGIWTVGIQTIGAGVAGSFNMWLPITQFLSNETYFLRPSPYVTLTAPAMAREVISVSAYNDSNNSFYARSGRGFSNDGSVKPDIAAPGVNISTALGKRTGSSYAAAITAGAVAQFFQWAVVERNYPLAQGQEVKTYLVLGASREPGVLYPDREWGYGRLNLRGVFERLAQIE